jgi:hypothetical protein
MIASLEASAAAGGLLAALGFCLLLRRLDHRPEHRPEIGDDRRQHGAHGGRQLTRVQRRDRLDEPSSSERSSCRRIASTIATALHQSFRSRSSTLVCGGGSAALQQRGGDVTPPSADGAGRDDHVPGAQVVQPQGISRRNVLVCSTARVGAIRSAVAHHPRTSFPSRTTAIGSGAP